jgi:hypothetical protein
MPHFGHFPELKRAIISIVRSEKQLLQAKHFWLFPSMGLRVIESKTAGISTLENGVKEPALMIGPLR